MYALDSLHPVTVGWHALSLSLQVKQGFEPPIFTCHFLGWNPGLWAQDKSYEAYVKEVCV